MLGIFLSDITCFVFESPERRLRNAKEEAAPASIISTSIDQVQKEDNKPRNIPQEDGVTH